MKLLLISAFLPILAFAQLKNIGYKFTHNQMQSNKPYIEKYLLKITDTATFFYSENNQEQIFESSHNSSMASGEIWNQLIVINNKKSFNIYDLIFTKEYSYSDTLNTIPWQILKDTASVLGKKCNVAKAFYRGHDWTAWFAPSIPCKYGPWILNGLPGLILRASADTNYMIFEAVSINEKVEYTPNIQEIKKTAIFTNHDAYIKERNYFNNNMMLYYQNDPLFKDTKDANGNPLFVYKGEEKVKRATYFEP